MKTEFKFIPLILILILSRIILSPSEGKTQMYWNQACQFAGNQASYISVPSSATTNLLGSFTMEAWVNPSNISATKGIISKGGSLEDHRNTV